MKIKPIILLMENNIIKFFDNLYNKLFEFFVETILYFCVLSKDKNHKFSFGEVFYQNKKKKKKSVYDEL
jgi:hypothetical protein